jgi:phosphonate transport system substrate-binding protein
MTNLSRRRLLGGALSGIVLVGLSGCGGGGGESASSARPALGISAIPDQDPELLNRLYPAVAERFAEVTDLEVTYRPVTEYTAVVRAFQRGDVHLAWMGGLTGVQARDLVPGADVLAQRDIDADFRTLFIATEASGVEPFDDVAGLTALEGRSLTFGSETSTSGRLMPQYFLQQAGLELSDLQGEPGFSGSHDATIEAVANGAFDVGAVNAQVWQATVDAGEVDLSGVRVVFRTPGYADYHWLVRPDIDEVYGEGTREAVLDLLLGLDADVPEDAEILELFGADEFVAAENSAYDDLEGVARDLGLLR